jgi:magnesium transporter
MGRVFREGEPSARIGIAGVVMNARNEILRQDQPIQLCNRRALRGVAEVGGTTRVGAGPTERIETAIWSTRAHSRTPVRGKWKGVQVANLLLPNLRGILKADPEQAREMAAELPPADLADVVERLSREDETAEPPEDLALRFVRLLSFDTAVRVIEDMSAERRKALFGKLEQALAVRILDDMAADERADLMAELPEEVRVQLLGKMTREEARDVRELLAYPESSAGGVMTTDFVAVKAGDTVQQAIETIRKVADDVETIYYAYAVAEGDHLVGVVSLRDLVVAKPDRKIQELMETNVITVHPEEHQEVVARTIARYDLLAMPVVDRSGVILGIVTVDDVVDVLVEEQTEDVQKMAAVEPGERPYFDTGMVDYFRRRGGWLLVLFIGEMLTGYALRAYEVEIQALAALAFYVPLIISSGGNSGSQSSAVIIRGLAINEIKLSDWARVAWREARVGLALGLSLGLIGVVRTLLWKDGISLAFAVGGGLIGVVFFGSVIGAMLPLLLRRMRFDPAVSSGPFIASLVDVVGILIYFEIAKAILRG